MLKGETTPWYPTMRLFRQTRPGDWSSVMDRVAEELSREKFEDRDPKFETHPNDQIAQNSKRARFRFRI
jgi:hypothetical protein